ncbi:hypothetical protein E0H22_02670 [Rhodopseudomonas boonkerdii]|uniref:hypothetical protein n=1 Tax=Rhodopseudomonas boonkerdii TaxID=475937 RepID=UPI001E57C52F|nr:hypothetical protein [Rhodopseudomonas boonkerdii]UGV24683.1 hypothetical protein E0H22_02670 [Rhodopseudomonas boonkerdii]
MLTPEKTADLRLKYLEMLQSLVTRMAGYGVSIKSYCITVVTAVLGFSFTLQRPAVAALALLPLITFALLDAQYLRVERRFRALFDEIRQQPWDAAPSFEINLKVAPKVPYWRALGSWSIVNFYGPLAVGVIIAVIGARYAYGK